MDNSNSLNSGGIQEDLINNQISTGPILKKKRCIDKIFNNIIIQLLLLWLFLSFYGISMVYLEYKIKSSSDKDLFQLFIVPISFSTIIIVLYLIIKLVKCCLKKRNIRGAPYNPFINNGI